MHAQSSERKPRPSLAEPVVIAEWKRNRRGELIRVSLHTFSEQNFIDLRTWWTGDDGERKPGKGFCVAVAHLPQLARTINDALAKSIELGLLEAE